MSSFWSAWVIGLTTVSLIAVTWLLFSNRKTTLNEDNEAKTGHVYDGIEEYDNPLPSWWFMLYLLTVIYGVLYLIAYPGMGNFKGLLNWTSTSQWQHDVEKADNKYRPIYEAYAQTPVDALAKDAKAMKIGQRLFANNCATCHGSNARGTQGYPDLTDRAWLYGSSAEQIKASITHGRTGAMPAWAASLGTDGLRSMTAYVQSLSKKTQGGSETEGEIEKVYATMCAACHGADAKGNIMLGAPDLSDGVWLYGGNEEKIMQSIALGRNGKMPAHIDILSEEKIHILTAYVQSLSK